MSINKEKFKNAKYLPLSREEVIAHIEGRGTTRIPFVMTPPLWKPDELVDKEMVEKEKELALLYPEDVQGFEYNRPMDFGTHEDYCWCDVAGAKPIHKTAVGIDEDKAIEWDIIEKISYDTPNPYLAKSLVQNYEEPDGRYSLIFWTRLGFERLWHFRGMQNTLMDFYMEPDKIKALLNKLVSVYKKGMDRARDEYHFDAWAMTDDIGTQERPFFSEEIFVEFFKPVYKEVISYAHEKGMHVWLHTCGNIEPFIPHLIEIGLDVLHPIQKYTMDEKKIVEQYADQICFWSGIDLQQTMPKGTCDEVREEVRYLIDTFYQPNKGRLIMGPSNRVSVEDIPVCNIEAFMDEIHEYGTKVGKENCVGNHKSPFLEKVKNNKA